MEMGMPFLIVALLGVIALSGNWNRVPSPWRWIAAAFIAVFALLGFALLGKTGSLGEQGLKKDLGRKEEGKE
jgi:predicted membrane metal-binding protein